MKNRKSLEAYTWFQNGWVRTVFHLKPETTPGHFILKGDVTPSMRTSEEPHHPWVAVNRNLETVAVAHCTCMAGYADKHLDS